MNNNPKKWKPYILDILNREYLPNNPGNPKHELSVKEITEKYFQEFEHQPNGSQRFPDFNLKINNKIVQIECKSCAKSSYPMWNSGLPKKDAVYVFCAKEYGTTIFLGQDVVSFEKTLLLEKFYDEIRSIHKKYKRLPGWKDVRGFDVYIRKAYMQAGGKDFVNYFTHPKRKFCEQRVMDFFG